MSAIIQMVDSKAEIKNYTWTSRDKILESFLNTTLSQYGPEASDPDPDGTEAKKIVDTYGATLIENKPPKYKYDSRVEY